jgi:hypothetical protein
VSANQPVTSISPLTGKPDEVVVVFRGDEALTVLRDLQRRLGVETEQEVVLRGVQLLVSAVGKDIVLRQGNHSEVIRLWQEH